MSLCCVEGKTILECRTSKFVNPIKYFAIMITIQCAVTEYSNFAKRDIMADIMAFMQLSTNISQKLSNSTHLCYLTCTVPQLHVNDDGVFSF